MAKITRIVIFVWYRFQRMRSKVAKIVASLILKQEKKWKKKVEEEVEQK